MRRISMKAKDFVDDREIRNLEPGDAADSPNPDSGPGWLLVGKLAPPEQRITVASRDALLARLDASLTRSLSVVVSPPGFGKTTLMTQWWRTLRLRQDLHACWLTLDDIDSEVSRFMAGGVPFLGRGGGGG